MKQNKTIIRIFALTLFILLISFTAVSCNEKQTPYELLDSSIERSLNLRKGSELNKIFERAKTGGSISAELNFEDKANGKIQNKLRTKLYMDTEKDRYVSQLSLVRGTKTIQNDEIYIGKDHFVISSNMLGNAFYGYDLIKLDKNATYDPYEEFLKEYLNETYMGLKIFTLFFGLETGTDALWAPYKKIIDDKFNKTEGIVTQEKDASGNYVVKINIDSAFLDELLTELYNKAKTDESIEEINKVFERYELFIELVDGEEETDDNEIIKKDLEELYNRLHEKLTENDLSVEGTFTITKTKKLISAFDINVSNNNKKICDLSVKFGKDSLLSKYIKVGVEYYVDGKAYNISYEFEIIENSSKQYAEKITVFFKHGDDKEAKRLADISLTYNKITGDYRLDLDFTYGSDLVPSLSATDVTTNVKISFYGSYVTTKKTATITLTKIKYEARVSYDGEDGPYGGNEFNFDFKFIISTDDKMPNVPGYKNLDQMTDEEYKKLEEEAFRRYLETEYDVSYFLSDFLTAVFGNIPGFELPDINV